jgi:hypothetical protein
VYEKDSELYGRIVINTTGYLEDDYIYLANFLSDVFIGKISLVSDAYIILYSTGNTSYTKTNLDQYLKTTGVALYKEDITLELGKKLDYLYTNYLVEYTPRKYLTYKDDVIATYKEDVYEVDETGTPVYKEVDTDGDGVADDIELVVLHKKGDPILDSNGNPIILHKKGEPILDEYNKPILDVKNGLIHMVDILLLEYQLYMTTNQNYVTYKNDLYQKLTDISTLELANINSRLLENTVIKYKPKNNLKDVKLIVNNVVYNSKNFVEPKVIIYVTDTTVTSDLITTFRKVVISNIQKLLRTYNRVSEIENALVELLGDHVVSVRISNLDTIGDVDIKNYTPDSSRITIAKKVNLDNLGNKILDLKLYLDVVSL